MATVTVRKPFVKKTMSEHSSKAWSDTLDFVRWMNVLIESLNHQGRISGNTGGNGKPLVRARDAARLSCKLLEELAIEQGLFRELHARGKLGSYTPRQHANENE